jgi:catechol 2,3-dioxygenase-like lactoylglutathione lyase family enzyme
MSATTLVRLAHVCIETTDLGASETFYQRLGAHRRFEFRNRQGLLIGIYMYFGEDSYIELVLVAAPRPEGAVNHFALQVADIDTAYNALVAAGIEVTQKALGVDHTWMVTCRDPNGVFIELHQYTDNSLQRRGGTCCIDYVP